jgi:multiple sugar transport system permease protein
VTTAIKVAAAPELRRPSKSRQDVMSWIALHSVAIALAIAFIAPIVFIFLTSVMSDQ